MCTAPTLYIKANNLSPTAVELQSETHIAQSTLSTTKRLYHSYTFIANTDLNDFVKANQIAVQS